MCCSLLVTTLVARDEVRPHCWQCYETPVLLCLRMYQQWVCLLMSGAYQSQQRRELLRYIDDCITVCLLLYITSNLLIILPIALSSMGIVVLSVCMCMAKNLCNYGLLSV